MLTRKPCKHCGSLWHSKAKCPQKPLHAFKDQKRTITPLSPQKPSEALKTPHRAYNERSAATKLADKLFSVYIRQKGMTWYLTNRCFTCGDELPWGQLQNGHFMSRRYINTRWNEINCNPQCNECNVVKHGNLVVYENKLRIRYGEQAIDDLIRLARSGNKTTLADIQAIIDLYK